MRQAMLIAMLIAVAVTVGCIAYINAATSTSPRPANYHAAAKRVLDAQGVDYYDVEVLDGCAPSYQLCQTYAGSVRVLATTSMLGRIECRERWTTCTITVQRAGIMSALLDDPINPLAARWEAFYGQFMLRLREYYHGEPLSR
jgi:hypothetical protein